MTDFSLSAGRSVRGDFAIYPNSLLFIAGDYEDKGFSITPAELAAAAAESRPVPFNLEHNKKGAHAATAGLFGGILRHWIDPDDPTKLRGEVAIPLPLDEKLATKAPSMEFAAGTKKIIGAALTYTPRVPEAALMSAAVEFAASHDFAMARHNTPEGQVAMQDLHDAAAWAKSVFSSNPPPDPVSAGSARTTHKPASPESAKGETMFDKLKALFSKAGVPDADIDAHLTEAVAEFTSGRPAPAGMTDGEKAQFSALLEDNKALKAAAIAKDAAAFADAAVLARRAYPSERANLVASFSQAADDDAAAPAVVTFSAGAETKTGSRLDAFRALVECRPPHGLTSEHLQTAAFSGGAVIPSAADTGALDQEKIDAQVERMLASTNIGQRILAEKKK